MKTFTKTKKVSMGKRSRLLFYVLGLAIPLLQYCVFYIGVHANTIFLAFKKYTYVDQAYISSFAGFENFIKVFKDFADPNNALFYGLANSFFAYVVGLVNTFVTILFSYYIFKGKIASKFFQVFLFIPHMLSGVVLVQIYRYFTENGVVELLKYITGNEDVFFSFNGTLTDPKLIYLALLFFGIFNGYGTGIMIYCGAMTSISDSIFDAAKIDSATPTREFFSIILPLIFPTLSALIIAGIGGIFTSTFNLYTFYGGALGIKKLTSVGYYLYCQTLQAKETGFIAYPVVSAFGLIITVVVIPITIVVKKLFDKYGPSVD